MNRVKRFHLRVTVSNEFRETVPDVVAKLAHQQLVDVANRDQTGPRGGRYIPIGEPYDFRDSGDNDYDWTRNLYSYVASVDARYVRPKRLETPKPS